MTISNASWYINEVINSEGGPIQEDSFEGNRSEYKTCQYKILYQQFDLIFDFTKPRPRLVRKKLSTGPKYNFLSW